MLINNASTFYPTPSGDITEIDWDDLLGTNLKAPLFLAQAADAELRGRARLVLNVTDIHGLRPLRRYPVYSIAKAGLIMSPDPLAREMGPDVRVNGSRPARCVARPTGSMRRWRQKIIRAPRSSAPGSAQEVARASCTLSATPPTSPGRCSPSTAVAASAG